MNPRPVDRRRSGAGPVSSSAGARGSGIARYAVPSRRCLCALLASALLAGAAITSASPSAAASSGASRAKNPSVSRRHLLVSGRQIYRKFCGQCHALAAARAAGFGSGKGLGTNGGPSFNELRVPFAFSVNAVSEPTGGHAQVKKKMRWKQLTEVARYIATVTSHHPIPALPTDG